MHVWPTVLRADDLTLRPIRWRDERAWARARAANREWLAPWEAADPTGAATASFGAWAREQRRKGRHATALSLVLEIGRDRFAGQIVASPIVYESARTASVGYWIAHRHAGHGYMPLALALLTDYLIFELALHRVEVNIRPENGASVRVVEKLGFVEEGVARGLLFIDGAWRDHRCFALRAEDMPRGGLAARYRAGTDIG